MGGPDIIDVDFVQVRRPRTSTRRAFWFALVIGFFCQGFAGQENGQLAFAVALLVAGFCWPLLNHYFLWLDWKQSYSLAKQNHRRTGLMLSAPADEPDTYAPPARTFWTILIITTLIGLGLSRPFDASGVDLFRTVLSIIASVVWVTLRSVARLWSNRSRAATIYGAPQPHREPVVNDWRFLIIAALVVCGWALFTMLTTPPAGAVTTPPPPQSSPQSSAP